MVTVGVSISIGDGINVSIRFCVNICILNV